MILAAIQLVLVSSFLLFSTGASFALSSKESLKGLKGVEVLVDEVGADLEEFNLTTSQVLGNVISRLRKAGIEVLSTEEDEKIQPLRKPYLAVKISSVRIKRILAFSIQIGLNQQVIVRGSPELKKTVFFSPTWYMNSMGAVGGTHVSEICEALNMLIDKFTSAYFEANPKH